MPLSFMPIKRLYRGRGKYFAGLVLLCASVLIFLVKSTQSRLIWDREASSKSSSAQTSSEETNEKSFLADAKEAVMSKAKTKPAEDYDEWCQARDYKDLSDHQVFGQFEEWMEQFEEISRDFHVDFKIHDYPNFTSFFQTGLKLSRTRAKILQSIIRGDPCKALEMAIDEEKLKSLPGLILRNMEVWQSEYADLEAMHVCYDPKHPKGLIKRTVRFQNGKNFRAWVYGKRLNLQSRKGLSIWGISIGDDLAVSDLPYREKEIAGEAIIALGDEQIKYANEYEKDLFLREIRESERRSSNRSHQVTYPLLAGSSGITQYYEKRYKVYDGLYTWTDAVQIANAQNGRLATIDSAEENRLIWNLLQTASTGTDSTLSLIHI